VADRELDQLTPLQRALVALKEMRQRIDLLEQDRNEPIAVIGLGCRFPGGVSDAASFWELLRDGRDAIREVPPDRYDVDALYDPTPGTPGKVYSRFGGFLDDLDLFAADFFHISPREAEVIDPQQRLALEVGWEALENAGRAHDLAGSRTGVFLGVSMTDYGAAIARHALQDNAYYGSGNTLNSVPGRLSYAFGLRGPSLAVDTACSSSLVAVHLACESLRRRECDLALAGGVNALLDPAVTVNICQARMLAPDGRCKTFDAAADGYVRGEGCGIVVLKRLSDALRDRDQLLAVIRASAVNHGGTSSGFTVPNPAAQQELLVDAWRAAGIGPADLDYLEAHGTGTSLGDPIEVQAIDAALATGREPGQKLAIGTVKTNIGHLESAAGIAALIKVIVCLQQEAIAANLHFKTPNPHIAWDQVRVAVVDRTRPWRRSARARVAGRELLRPERHQRARRRRRGAARAARHDRRAAARTAAAARHARGADGGGAAAARRTDGRPPRPPSRRAVRRRLLHAPRRPRRLRRAARLRRRRPDGGRRQAARLLRGGRRRRRARARQARARPRRLPL
jgi:acyl transferase domain-containing protein